MRKSRKAIGKYKKHTCSWSGGYGTCTRPAGFFQLLQSIGVCHSHCGEVLSSKETVSQLDNSLARSLLTLALVPRNTVFRSLCSTSFCLIFLTTSTSCTSVTQRRFKGVAVGASTTRVRGVIGWLCPVVRGGVPGCAVDTAASFTKKDLQQHDTSQNKMKKNNTHRYNPITLLHQPIYHMLPLRHTHESHHEPVFPPGASRRSHATHTASRV